MSWRDELDAALLTWLQGRVPDAATLIGWEDEPEASGCSCGDRILVEFRYRRPDGSRGYYTHDGSLAELINSLAA